MRLRRRALGDEHPDVAADRAALATILDAAGKTAEAEALLRDALSAFERAFGPDDHEVAVTLNNLAALLARTGLPEATQPLYRRALAIKERTLGDHHPQLAPTLNNLAMARAAADPGEAAALLERAVAVLEATVEPRTRRKRPGKPRRPQPAPSVSGYRRWVISPNSSSVGVEKFDDRFAAATICAPLCGSYIVTVLKPKIAPS